MTDEAEAPGWDAIDRAVKDVYGDAEPEVHWGTVHRWSLGGPDPLDGISVYRREEPLPHWHYVSYGLSELYVKDTSDPELSGYGFELTARLRREGEDEPPVFMANVLQNLARYVFETGNVFNSGDSIDLFGPILNGSDTAIHAAMFFPDPELKPGHSTHGHVSFLQVVGVTVEERSTIRTWNAQGVQPVLQELLPVLMTDLHRPTLLLEPRFMQTIEEGRAREGSSMGGIHASDIAIAVAKRLPKRPATITLPATLVDTLALVLPLRLPFGHPFHIESREVSLTFAAGQELQLTAEGETRWKLTMTNDQVRELAATLRPLAGSYHLPSAPQVRFQVERTAIRDQNDKITSYVG